jgi:hypothetical protein
MLTSETMAISYCGIVQQVLAGCSKRPFSKTTASEEARRYEPHFVWPFTPRIDLGERISPDSASDLREVFLNV